MSPLKKRTYRTSLERGSICLFCRAGAFQWVFRSLGLHGQYFGRGQAGKDIVVLANLNTSWAIRDWARELVHFFFYISISPYYFFSLYHGDGGGSSTLLAAFLFSTEFISLKLGLHIGIGRYVGGREYPVILERDITMSWGSAGLAKHLDFGERA